MKRDDILTVLRAFKRDYAEQYGILEIGVFGSFARDEAGEDSDVDIVFETDDPNLFKTVMMKQDLEGWLGRPVDVLQLRGLTNLRLRARVEKEAVYV